MTSLSVWEKESFFAPQDIIIIGSGFNGLWSALHLMASNPGKKITVLERGLIPTGASTRNAGFSCFGSPSELVANIEEFGEDITWQLVEMRYKGLLKIRQYFPEDVIGYECQGGYECFTENSKDWLASSGKLGLLNKGLKAITGKENIFTIADEKLAEFGFTGFDHLIENPLEAGLHPGKLVQALLKKVQSLGVQVITSIGVESFAETDKEVTVFTSQNIRFTTRQLLFCTNAFSKKLLPDVDIRPCRGQVLITGPIPHFKIKGTFHFDQGFYYFRNLDNRLLLGGARNKDFEGENTDELEISDSIQEELELFIKRHLLPQTDFAITDRWSGIMAMGKEKMPLVKALSNRTFCCVRMGGMGVALAPETGLQITKIMNAVW